ncbi:DUF2330 domain-containing protein [Nocardia puris]|uniref:DUF2330 domain-containing protein n=1 Tax=Nocardia puris TaxID=208602 RepID=A0A366DBZ4_9NOCA|nr:DUF2330 domain-containing protein [Nocardia puris]MBF6211822.1 DUF2330 domain-containing protein [Nocardia puris]MBF6365825.1 DUF2330 domain-containing protein [Nocardia puris]MBF6460532.1 DUF2330 domain-containing protein [Nocardia puris]RBO87536.1 hypothetical protein DFR74_111243 [Nocardia puris]
MRSILVARFATVAAVLCASAGIGALAPVSACACGGIVSPGDTATVRNEVAVVRWDGVRETILMQLALGGGAEEAALLVPTPTPARVEAGSSDTFRELERLTEPEIVTDRRWFADQRGDASGGAPGSAPTVLEQVTLGPLEATTLTGGALDGVRAWLDENGYELRPEVTATLEPYLREGWSFVAMRLVADAPLDGALDPVRLTFDSDRFVYPMRMSAAAREPQSVRLYLLGEHRLERTDADAASQRVGVDFAGRITDTDDPALRELLADGHDYLTEMWIAIREPAEITTDFTFAPAAEDTDYRRRIHRTEDMTILGAPAGPILLGAGVVIVLGAVVTSRRMFRS